jgi:hypothetical protein
MRAAVHARAAAVTFAVEAGYAIVHCAVGGHYTGFTLATSIVIDVLLAIVWGASAVTGFALRPWQGAFVMLLGFFSTVMFAAVFTTVMGVIGLGPLGIPFLLLTPFQAVWVWHGAPAFFEHREEREEVATRRPRLAWLHLRHAH